MPADWLVWETNLGTIIPLVFTAGIFYAVTRNDIKALKDSIVKIDRAMEKQTETIQQISVQKAQLESQSAQIAEILKAQHIVDQRLYDLSRGQGFVKYRSSVEGEYP